MQVAVVTEVKMPARPGIASIMTATAALAEIMATAIAALGRTKTETEVMVEGEVGTTISMGTMIVVIGRAVIESEVAVAGALEMMKEPAVETETATGTTTEMGSAVMIVQTRIMLTLAAVGEGAAIEIEGMVV